MDISFLILIPVHFYVDGLDISQARFDNPKEAPSTVESLLSPKFQIERLKRDKSIANPCPAEEDA